ncbi:MAG: MBL fold metallo-hydrolase [Anaerovoracaceae bacterium]
MAFRFCSFSSGSSGNSYLIKTEETALIIDAGISGKKVLEGLEATETPIDKVKGVLVTHEHIDHVKSLKVLSKKLPEAYTYANRGTWSKIAEDVPEEKRQLFVTGDGFNIGDIFVKPFSISHDAAEPVGFSFFHGEKQISIVTDTGYISEDIFSELKDADILALEANHDENMLKVGHYPWHVKQRILGDKGHLSNTAAGKCLSRMLSEGEKKPRQVMLAHLSRENNFPEMAYQTVKNVLEESQHYIGGSLKIDMILKDKISCIYEV